MKQPQSHWQRKTFKNDRQLAALKPASAVYDAWDAHRSNLIARIMPSGRRTFALVARFGGKKHPTRRALGEYPTLTLEEARAKADEWNKLLKRGVDPKLEEERMRLEELRKQATTFGAVVDDYIEQQTKAQRRGKDVARELRQEFKAWASRPITSITRLDVVSTITAIAKRGPYQARNQLGHLRALYSWAINDGRYGLEASPTDHIKPALLIGKRKPRQRVLDDDELGAFWSATEKLGYPFGSLWRVLLLTGARLNEVARANWSEVDLDRKVLTIPPERFKSDATHLIPLTDPVLEILANLPRFSSGWLFTSAGEKPVIGFASPKARLDALMSSPSPFVIHDLRRTVRTRLASLRIPDTIAEAVLGHGRKGLQRVYDQHAYEQEMREALTLWASRLRDIVTPPPVNVVKMRASQ
jgi:integrase